MIREIFSSVCEFIFVRFDILMESSELHRHFENKGYGIIVPNCSNGECSLSLHCSVCLKPF